MDWYNRWSPAERMATLPLQREAIRTGRIAAPTTCSICGVTPEPGSANPVWLHDEDYADPLGAYHVCRACHRVLHERFDRPEAWDTLISRHGSGKRWFEMLTMNRASMRRPFREIYPDGLPSAEA